VPHTSLFNYSMTSLEIQSDRYGAVVDGETLGGSDTLHALHTTGMSCHQSEVCTRISSFKDCNRRQCLNTTYFSNLTELEFAVSACLSCAPVTSLKNRHMAVVSICADLCKLRNNGLCMSKFAIGRCILPERSAIAQGIIAHTFEHIHDDPTFPHLVLHGCPFAECTEATKHNEVVF
jgi:hypothetical protein